jgi:hypothetical protein
MAVVNLTGIVSHVEAGPNTSTINLQVIGKVGKGKVVPVLN